MTPPTPAALLLVGAGGAVGSIARYLLATWTMHSAAPQKFPLGTFVVNLAGCLAAGLLAVFAAILFGQERLKLRVVCADCGVATAQNCKCVVHCIFTFLNPQSLIVDETNSPTGLICSCRAAIPL